MFILLILVQNNKFLSAYIHEDSLRGQFIVFKIFILEKGIHQRSQTFFGGQIIAKCCAAVHKEVWAHKPL